MDIPHPLLKRMIALVALGVLLCAGAAVAVIVLRPPSFSSHREVVVSMIEQRGLAVETVDASLPWPDSVNYFAYGPDVYPYSLDLKVRMHDAQKLSGRVECNNDQFDCALTIVALGFDRTPMPDISTGKRIGWPDWLSKLAARAGISVDDF